MTDDTTRTWQPLPTDRPVRVALLGHGLAGSVFHGPLLAADPRYAVTVVMTSSPERAEAARSAHPGVEIVPDADAVWERAGDLDLAVVATPGETHARFGIQALEHGLACVLDKPACTTAAEGAELLATQARTGVPLTVFHNRRFDGDFLTARRLLREGRLGELVRIESSFEVWKPTVTKAWKAGASPAEGGGVLYDLGPHLIDQAVQLAGPVEDSYAVLRALRAGALSDDDAVVVLRHESGVVSHLTASTQARRPGPRMRVLGTEGAWTCYGLDGQEKALGAGASPSDGDFGEAGSDRGSVLTTDAGDEAVPLERGDYPRFYAELADALQGRGEVPVDPADAVGVVGLIADLHRRHPVRPRP